MKLKFAIFLYLLLPLQLLAQGVEATRSVGGAIPGDNIVRYYRLALPVTVSAFEEEFYGNKRQLCCSASECECGQC